MGRVSSFLYRVMLAPLATIATEAAIAQSAPPLSGIQAVERTYLERAAIAAANEKCRLFTDGERMALQAGLFQARNELLRADYAVAQINALTAEVSAHAKTLGCEHPSVQNVAATIRDSYRQFAKTNFMTFPGKHADWEASRSIHDTWGTKQTQPDTGAILGLRRIDPADERTAPRAQTQTGEKVLRLAASVPATGPAPSSAQLRIRDPAKLSEPWIGGLMGDRSGLTPPPRAVATPIWAGRQANEWAARNEPVYVFYFGQDAIDRIEALDPREAVTLELTPSPRAREQEPTRIVFEAGDFAAAHHFVMIPKPQPTAVEPSATADVASAH